METIKEILINYFQETRVSPPITRNKVRKAGYELTPFLLELKRRLEKASDLKETKAKKTLDAFFQACEKLM